MPRPPPETASPPSGIASNGDSASNPMGMGVASASVPNTGSSSKASTISECSEPDAWVGQSVEDVGQE